MKTTIEKRDVVTGGIVESNAFSVEVNAKTFKVLIDGLYSNKIQAVIRELWSNAFDSHAEARKTHKQFVCHLPNTIDPTFSVRDFGVSLKHEDVMSLYTTMFRSTKEDTNDQVGKLGLGSKSPFAYTDTFTVTAWLDGEKRTYSVFIDSDGIPKIALFDTVETKSKNGLEVSFPVQTDDITTFKRTAQQVARGFTHPPKIMGQDISISEQEIALQGDGWCIYGGSGNDDYYSTSNKIGGARQGCVIYPIDANSLGHDIDYTMAALCDSNCVIDFPIGSLEISASRESLGYDDRTKSNIKKTLRIVIDSITEKFQESVDKYDTKWEASLSLAWTKKDIPHALRTKIIKNLTFKGESLSPYIEIDVTLLERVNVGIVSAYDARRWKHVRFKRSSTFNIQPLDTIVVIDDASVNKVASRIKLYSDRNPKTSFVWIKGDLSEASVQNVLEEMGNPPTTLASSMECPEGPVRCKTVSTPVTIKRWINGMVFTDAEFTPTAGSVYVDLERKMVKQNHGKQVHDESLIHWVKSYLVNQGIMEENDYVYGVPATHKKMPKREGMVNLFQLFEDALEESYDVKKAQDRLVAQEGISIFRNNTMDSICAELQESRKFKKLKHTGPVQALINRVKEVRETIEEGNLHTKLRFYKRAARFEDVQDDAIKQGAEAKVLSDELRVLEQAVKRTYPMLARLNFSVNQEFIKDVCEYITLVDNDLAAVALSESQANNNERKAA